MSFFLNDTATTEIYTLSLHDALPICAAQALGMAEIPIVKVDMSDQQMRIATISHNTARGNHDIELEVQVLRDLESLGALDWAQDSLMISDDEIPKLLKDIPAPEP